MIKPPMFSSTLSGTPAQQLMHRARMFRIATIGLVDSSNGEQFLPKYALLTHAIELALKAFASYSVATGKRPFNHLSNQDLRGLYQLALRYGLPENPTITEYVECLHELHFTHYLRYPKEPTTPVPDLSIIVDSTVDYLFEYFTPLINPR
ncbi:MAG: hypothetical protein ACLPTZ_13555 [Beijerinckiaceae bacterium]